MVNGDVVGCVLKYHWNVEVGAVQPQPTPNKWMWRSLRCSWRLTLFKSMAPSTNYPRYFQFLSLIIYSLIWPLFEYVTPQFLSCFKVEGVRGRHGGLHQHNVGRQAKPVVANGSDVDDGNVGG